MSSSTPRRQLEPAFRIDLSGAGRLEGLCFARLARMLREEADRLALEAARHRNHAAGELAAALYTRVAQMQADGAPCCVNGEYCADCPLLENGDLRNLQNFPPQWVASEEQIRPR